MSDNKVKIIQIESLNSTWAMQELERKINECIRENRGNVRDVKINILASDAKRHICDLYIATIIFSDPFDNVVPEVTFE